MTRCLTCRMATDERLVALPFCSICRDQVMDFAYVSVILAATSLVLGVPWTTWLVEETLVFVGLVVVKHKIHPRLKRWLHDHPPPGQGNA